MELFLNADSQDEIPAHFTFGGCFVRLRRNGPPIQYSRTTTFQRRDTSYLPMGGSQYNRNFILLKTWNCF
jgi:hypothetical protein